LSAPFDQNVPLEVLFHGGLGKHHFQKLGSFLLPPEHLLLRLQ
jgi:hypothetical protein